MLHGSGRVGSGQAGEQWPVGLHSRSHAEHGPGNTPNKELLAFKTPKSAVMPLYLVQVPFRSSPPPRLSLSSFLAQASHCSRPHFALSSVQLFKVCIFLRFNMSSKTPAAESEPVINDNPALQSLYKSFESRIGYWLLLGNTRHFGYWEKDTHWVFPLGGPLRRMEDKMHKLLDLAPGSQVLDAGCGVGHVALYMASRGLRVTAIDVLDHHLAKAKRNVARSGALCSLVSVQKMDYHHLETLPSESHDGVYTMETLVHATDPLEVLKGFYRILRPGGHVAMHEYDHDYESDEVIGKTLAKLMREVSEYGAMPTWQRARRGYYKQILEEAGFIDVEEHDYSENVRPMLRLFWLLSAIPYYFIVLFRLEKYFVNAIGGARGYYAQKYWRYVAISARKPTTGGDGSTKS